MSSLSTALSLLVLVERGVVPGSAAARGQDGGCGAPGGANAGSVVVLNHFFIKSTLNSALPAG